MRRIYIYVQRVYLYSKYARFTAEVVVAAIAEVITAVLAAAAAATEHTNVLCNQLASLNLLSLTSSYLSDGIHCTWNPFFVFVQKSLA